MSHGGVLLDWDGTVLHSRDALVDCWHVTSEEVLGRRFPVTDDDYARVFRQRAHELFASLTDDAQ